MEFSIEWVGWIGLSLLLLAWVPQTFETIREGKCSINLGFIILYVAASATLATYAYLIDDPVFMTLNLFLTLGSGLNFYYKLFPRVHG